ncbi:TPA: hypothetical protein ACF39K_004571 [Vibrio parahaemolyticus]|uniref:hypothetical protein n=1 Tax=Vibrio parahaemolyticus TaxID=670 RepID=UPI001A8E3F70|nr:hypothetical protein [Vibrio parahaemolyticus]MBO0160014.1 hypothetical protein [Vibrio parahaemolyticus]MBO0175223.1 hypothetical protein [Vibrio parahaemolyticus]MEA5286004.1 hypothetical protein [Vibrio parahaemolyticus]HBH7918955.1 hypothetical protein [Vibrio parahaemolyticus]HCE1578210.1 hypothetical protein [Vibrio parahaemolyticus]
MEYAEFLLPSIILMLSFLLKMCIDREVDIPTSIYAVLELPVDVFVLATSFVAAFTIANPEKFEKGISFFSIYVALVVVTVILWRKSCKSFEAEKHKVTVGLTFANYCICLFALYKSIVLV